jgi:hypothetical protein
MCLPEAIGLLVCANLPKAIGIHCDASAMVKAFKNIEMRKFCASPYWWTFAIYPNAGRAGETLLRYGAGRALKESFNFSKNSKKVKKQINSFLTILNF